MPAIETRGGRGIEGEVKTIIKKIHPPDPTSQKKNTKPYIS